MTDAIENPDKPIEEKLTIDREDIKEFRSTLYSHGRIAKHFEEESNKCEVYMRTLKKHILSLEKEIRCDSGSNLELSVWLKRIPAGFYVVYTL